MNDDAATQNVAGPRPFHRGWWIVFALLALLPAVWAGDAPFIVDEPVLIGKALRANAEHRWETAGLTSPVGRTYGPMAVWIYQAGLRFSLDPIDFVRGRAVLVTAVTLAGAAWIAWLLGVGGVWVLLIGVSPYLLFYSRHLWDNSFNIPLACLAAACTLHVLIRPALWPLPILAAVLGAMLLVHLMAVATAAGAVVTLLLFGRRALAGKTPRDVVVVALALLVVLALGWWISAGYRAVYFKPTDLPYVVSSAPNSGWFALLSPRLLSGVWLDYFFPADYLAAMPWVNVLDLAEIISSAIFLFAWAGIGYTIVGLRRERDAITIAGTLALSILIFQTILNVWTHTFGHPHYYNATWIAPAILVAVTMKRLARSPKFAAYTTIAVATIAASLALSVVLLAQQIHRTGGTRDPMYGSTISNQLAVVREMQQFSPRSPLALQVMIFPESIETLSQWIKQNAPASENRPTRSLVIRYVNPADPTDGRIELDHD